MKCTNRFRVKAIAICGVCVMTLGLSGCAANDIKFNNKYSYSSSATNLNIEKFIENPETDISYFGDQYCVIEDTFTKKDNVSDHVVSAMGVFRPKTGEVTYAKNIYQKMYPASVTKILTAYLAITKGDLDSIVTASSYACDQASDSSKCGLAAGDQITLGDLVYGLMLPSGNDAAIAIAEHISGSVEEFANLMNETAYSFGATNSHFINPNGLHNEEHYTTVYDLYLIFSNCIKDETFVKYISTKSYTAYFTDASGAEKVKTWTNTNKYVNGAVAIPSGMITVGGKTGTTNAAGYCLIMLSDIEVPQGEPEDPVISIILKAGSRDDLYFVMNQIIRDARDYNS